VQGFILLARVPEQRFRYSFAKYVANSFPRRSCRALLGEVRDLLVSNEEQDRLALASKIFCAGAGHLSLCEFVREIRGQRLTQRVADSLVFILVR
jgi:hypothetical protein